MVEQVCTVRSNSISMKAMHSRDLAVPSQVVGGGGGVVRPSRSNGASCWTRHSAGAVSAAKWSCHLVSLIPGSRRGGEASYEARCTTCANGPVLRGSFVEARCCRVGDGMRRAGSGQVERKLEQASSRARRRRRAHPRVLLPRAKLHHMRRLLAVILATACLGSCGGFSKCMDMHARCSFCPFACDNVEYWASSHPSRCLVCFPGPSPASSPSLCGASTLAICPVCFGPPHRPTSMRGNHQPVGGLRPRRLLPPAPDGSPRHSSAVH